MDADIVIAGAGHNSLIAGCYLAKAGYRCVVLDARAIPGGGAATEEILEPGYLVDSCSTGHTLIRANPLLVDDELGLIREYGLSYLEPDPVAHVAFPDGEHLTMWLDFERTVEEIARFSASDAEAYRRIAREYDEVSALFTAAQFTPIGFGPSLDQRLADHPAGRVWARRRALSAWDVIRREFSDRHVQSFMLWMAFQTLQTVDTPGSGMLAYSLILRRQMQSWSIPVGGSGQLTAALVSYLESHGGTVICNKQVSRLLLNDEGRCVGVETLDGDSYRAGTAVLSTIHVKHLIQMAPLEVWPADFRYGIDTYNVGVSGFAAYLGTKVPPVFETPNGGVSAVSAGTVGWPEDVVQLGADLRAGRFIEGVPWLLVATPTLVDPDRAPAGMHTVKLLSAQCYELPPGSPGWDTVKHEVTERQLTHLRRFAPSFTDDAIVSRLVKAPTDIERSNLHMVQGAFHGGDRGPAFSGPQRPAPGWASHRMPIPGLYQTGGTTHPGGSVTGGPGRNAAMVLLHDLGHDLSAVVAAAPSGVSAESSVGRS
ncbi:MAG: phytoene desaturase family protein [Nocardioidaceae bacterium]